MTVRLECRCGLIFEMHETVPVVTCLCGVRHVWAGWNLRRYVADPVCRECDAPARAYRNGYDEAMFLCDAHERARWALR